MLGSIGYHNELQNILYLSINYAFKNKQIKPVMVVDTLITTFGKQKPDDLCEF